MMMYSPFFSLSRSQCYFFFVQIFADDKRQKKMKMKRGKKMAKE